MESVDRQTVKLPPEPVPRPPRLRRVLRSRTWHIAFPIVTFLVGMLTSLLILLLVTSIIGGNKSAVNNPSASRGDIVIQVGSAYIKNLVSRNLQVAGQGKVKNVQVKLASGDRMTVQGDVELPTPVLSVTGHLTINVQPYVSKCQLQVHILHADVSGITITKFATSFEGQINKELHVNSTGFPSGFTYCDIGVRTTPSDLFITYSAKPIGKTP